MLNCPLLISPGRDFLVDCYKLYAIIILEGVIMKIKDTKSLGMIIKQTRKKQGLTQSELAAIVGVGIRFIRELEAGKTSCHLSKTLAVLNSLGIDLFITERGS